jgi:hypothetical protein
LKELYNKDNYVTLSNVECAILAFRVGNQGKDFTKKT